MSFLAGVRSNRLDGGYSAVLMSGSEVHELLLAAAWLGLCQLWRPHCRQDTAAVFAAQLEAAVGRRFWQADAAAFAEGTIAPDH